LATTYGNQQNFEQAADAEQQAIDFATEINPIPGDPTVEMFASVFSDPVGHYWVRLAGFRFSQRLYVEALAAAQAASSSLGKSGNILDVIESEEITGKSMSFLGQFERAMSTFEKLTTRCDAYMQQRQPNSGWLGSEPDFASFIDRSCKNAWLQFGILARDLNKRSELNRARMRLQVIEPAMAEELSGR
jgi:tetratricopeptide (TPR) repeat protein